LLELQAICAGYGKTEVLHGVDLGVAEGEIVTIIGANGAGKSTLLRTISGVVRPSSGTVSLAGERLDRLGVEGIVRRRVVHIPEGRRLFSPLSVQENLALGSYSRRKGDRTVGERLERSFDLFPRLRERRRQPAGTLSGGEQQMLAVARALMAEPRLLLLDEPSMGLAPIVVREIFTSLRRLNEEGLTMVLVEQDARIALSLAHRGVVMERGRIAIADTAQGLLDNPEVRAIYFGRGTGSRGHRTEGA
jgi:branched-chain amino acid transport system ATP-binding protein